MMARESGQIRKKLEKIATHLKLATDSANLGTGSWDIETGKLEWNALHKKMWGYDENKEDIAYEDWYKVIVDGYKEKVSKIIEKAKVDQTVYSVDYRINRANDNALRYIRSVGKFYYNDKGEAETSAGISIDITEQKEAENKIKESEQRVSEERMMFYNSLMNAPAAIAIFKGNTHIYEFANAEYEKLIDRKIIIGQTIQEHFPEIEQQGVIDILNNVYSTGEPFIANEFPVELINKKTGKRFLRNYNSVIQPIKDAKGNTVRILSHGVDVTQQVKARQQIEESESKFRTLSETVPHMIWTATPEGKKDYFNKYFLQYTGKTFEELSGDGWQATIFAEDLTKGLEIWQHSIKTGEDFTIEKRILRHDGTYRWHLCHCNAQKDEKGNIIGWIGTNTEIEEQIKIAEALARGEEQFRTFANSIQNLAWIANGEGWIYWYNQRWLDYTGLTLEEMEGWGWQKVHHPDHVEKIKELSKELWEKGEAFELTFPLRRHDGEYRWFLTKAFPLKDANGNVERWIGTNTDITEQKSFTEALEEKVNERTQELHEMNLQLEHSNAELISFSYVASHDLQEPLRKIQMFTSRILETEYNSLSENARNYFDRMQRSAYRMQKLIQDLIAYSRVNVKETQFENVDLNEIIKDVKETLREELDQYDVTFKLNNICDIKIIPVQFTQVILNLVSNAIKFAKADQPIIIEIDCEEIKGKKTGIASLSDEVDYIHIRVSDNGIGFEPEYNEKIFEVFQRLHGKEEYIGTGMGLAIVKRIIENHDGIIFADGRLNEGATFNMYIPA